MCCHHYWASPDAFSSRLRLENLCEYYSLLFLSISQAEMSFFKICFSLPPNQCNQTLLKNWKIMFFSFCVFLWKRTKTLDIFLNSSGMIPYYLSRGPFFTSESRLCLFFSLNFLLIPKQYYFLFLHTFQFCTHRKAILLIHFFFQSMTGADLSISQKWCYRN